MLSFLGTTGRLYELYTQCMGRKSTGKIIIDALDIFYCEWYANALSDVL